jgi:hypothetical protein
MLIPVQYNERGIFERVLRARNGVLMRVRFEVVEINGELHGRVIGYEPVIELSAGYPNTANTYNPSQCLLACPEIGETVPLSWLTEKKITSPFSAFEFLTSIKPRAPTLA